MRLAKRIVALLRLCDNMTVAEIAEALGTYRNSANKSIHELLRDGAVKPVGYRNDVRPGRSPVAFALTVKPPPAVHQPTLHNIDNLLVDQLAIAKAIGALKRRGANRQALTMLREWQRVDSKIKANFAEES